MPIIYEFIEFNSEFDYEKDFYEVLLPDGTIVPQCWPNDGKMNATDCSGRSWDWNSGVKVRPDVANWLGD
jgi:hypothetical protein